jgi:hypothetical protein
MKRLLLFLLVVPLALISAQVHSISVSAEYALGLATRLNVDHAKGFGGIAEIRLTLSGDLVLGLASGFATYRIEQADQLNEWGWNFWNERYYPKILSDMRADPNLTTQIGSVQSMDLIPVALMFEYAMDLGGDLRIVPAVGGGVAFFTRELYADETWTKRFPQSDHTLTYNLRNFAPDKHGRSYFLVAGLDARYGLGAGVSLSAGVQYRQYLTSVSGSGQFPFTNALGMICGVTFNY